MTEVVASPEYSRWFDKVRDTQARARILVRIRRLSLGNFGDMSPVGEGVSELRIHYGPGYRVYLIRRGETLVILLGGGDKSSQKHDILSAKAVAQRYR